MPLSSPAWNYPWQGLTARFCGIGSVAAHSAARCFSSALSAIGDTVIAALHAVIKPASKATGQPTSVTNRARRGGSITTATSANTGAAAVKSKPG